MRELYLHETRALHELRIGVCREVAARGTQSCGVRFVGIKFRPRDSTHHPRGVGVDAGSEVRLLVIWVSDVGRHIGVIAKESLVECGNGGCRVTHTLHANGREVDIEVATKAGD